jgi:hypothetical protein
VDRLVDDPDSELKVSLDQSKIDLKSNQLTCQIQRKKDNKKLNEKKTGQNKAGQQAIRKRCANPNGEWLDPDLQPQQPDLEEDESDSGQPVRKRARRTW